MRCVLAVALAVALLALAACDEATPGSAGTVAKSAPAPSAEITLPVITRSRGSRPSPALGSGSAAAAPLASVPRNQASPPRSPQAAQDPACPADMVRVKGRYCPSVEQKCLAHHPEYEREQRRIRRAKKKGKKVHSTVSERCLRYREPSRCLSKKRTLLDYCIDRFEWPNRRGELPMFLVSWYQARKHCKRVGKRLCTVREFNFACEGEAMLPYTYGYVRDAEKCAIDKAYIRRQRNLKTYEKCLRDSRCKKELERLDQREPAGARPACVSPFGVYDLNGNINEWVRRPGKERPNRSGLKSGWWGPVRGRCRPTVGFHKESDYGYEVGFRCCRDTAAN